MVGIENLRTFAAAIREMITTLGYGVMVTLQILVLSFLVRVRVPQQEKPSSLKLLGFFHVQRFHIQTFIIDKRLHSSMSRIFILLLSLLGLHPANAQSPEKELENMKAWHAGSIVSSATVARFGIAHCFTVSQIPNNIFARMQGKSYPKGCTIPRKDLRYLRLLHVDKDGHIKLGEMVCNKAIAADVITIFRELYNKRYPIESVRLIDDFGANDERSMRANNSSSFCFRTVKGSKKLSPHATGMAVDVNTLYNPYYHKSKSGKVSIQPQTGKKYLNRDAKFPYKIVRGDLAWRLFTSHGFEWGGAWRTMKDYQHFEK